MKFMAALLVGLILFALPARAQGDVYIIVYKINGKFLDVQALSGTSLTNLIDSVRVLEGDAIADEIQSYLDSGALVIGLGPPQTSGGGWHDYNTIGLNPSRGKGTHQARALLHEFEHFKRANIIWTTTGFPSGDPAVVGPCGAGKHSDMNAATAASLCADGPTGDTQKDKSLCQYMDEYLNTAIEQHKEASTAGCVGYPPKSDEDIAPKCDWCNGNQ